MWWFNYFRSRGGAFCRRIPAPPRNTITFASPSPGGHTESRMLVSLWDELTLALVDRLDDFDLVTSELSYWQLDLTIALAVALDEHPWIRTGLNDLADPPLVRRLACPSRSGATAELPETTHMLAPNTLRRTEGPYPPLGSSQRRGWMEGGRDRGGMRRAHSICITSRRWSG